MDLLTTLAARAGSFTGRGVNHENEAFTGRLVVSAVMAGRAVTLVLPGGRRSKLTCCLPTMS